MSIPENVIKTEFQRAEETLEQKEFLRLLKEPRKTPIWQDPESDDRLWAYSERLAQSTMVPKDYIGKTANIYVAIQHGEELGLQPLQALQNIAVINGRPSLWGDAMLALVRASGLLEDFKEEFDAATETAICLVKRKGFDPHTETFSMADAKRANLTGKDTPWKTYPERMCTMRARSWALRDQFTDVLRGVYERSEAEDLARQEPDPLANYHGPRSQTPDQAKLTAPPTVDDLIEGINKCEEEPQLHDPWLIEQIAKLEGEAKEKVGQAWKDRRKAIKVAANGKEKPVDWPPQEHADLWTDLTDIAKEKGREEALSTLQACDHKMLGGEQGMAGWVDQLNDHCSRHDIPHVVTSK